MIFFPPGNKAKAKALPRKYIFRHSRPRRSRSRIRYFEKNLYDPRSYYDFMYDHVLDQLDLLKSFRPPESTSFSGGFLFSLGERLKVLLREDLHNFRFFVDFYETHLYLHFGLSWKDYWRKFRYWVFAFPVLTIIVFLHIYFFWRCVLYFAAPIESFFENFLFSRFGEQRFSRLSFFYRSIFQPLRRSIYGIYLFLPRLYSIDWNKLIFWRILYHIYLRAPILRQIYRPAWRFERYLRRVEIEVEIDGWEGYFLRILRPFTRPVIRFFFISIEWIGIWWRRLFTRKGRQGFRLYLRGRHLIRKNERLIRRKRIKLFWHHWTIRRKIFALDFFYSIKILFLTFKAQPKACFLLLWSYFLIGLCFPFEILAMLTIRFLGPGFLPSRLWKSFLSWLRRRG